MPSPPTPKKVSFLLPQMAQLQEGQTYTYTPGASNPITVAQSTDQKAQTSTEYSPYHRFPPTVPLASATREHLTAALAALDQEEKITVEERMLQAEWPNVTDDDIKDHGNTFLPHITWDPLRRPHQLFGDKVNVHSPADITPEEVELLIRFIGEYGREATYPHADTQDYDPSDGALSAAEARLWKATGKWAKPATIQAILAAAGVMITYIDRKVDDGAYCKSRAEYEAKKLRLNKEKIERLQRECKIIEDGAQKKVVEGAKVEEAAVKQSPELSRVSPVKRSQRKSSSTEITMAEMARLIIKGPPRKRKVSLAKKDGK